MAHRCEDYPACGHELNDCDGSLYGSDESIKAQVERQWATGHGYCDHENGIFNCEGGYGDFYDDDPPATTATCGTCGRSWDVNETPTPAGRCPYEYDHEYEDPIPVTSITGTIQLENGGHVLFLILPDGTARQWSHDTGADALADTMPLIETMRDALIGVTE